jgi:hypothetical protein
MRFAGDIVDEATVERLAGEVLDRFGRVDVRLRNALCNHENISKTKRSPLN